MSKPEIVELRALATRCVDAGDPQLLQDFEQRFAMAPARFLGMDVKAQQAHLQVIAQGTTSADSQQTVEPDVLIDGADLAQIGFVPIWVDTLLSQQHHAWQPEQWPHVASAICAEMRHMTADVKLARLQDGAVVVQSGLCQITQDGVNLAPLDVTARQVLLATYPPLREAVLVAVGACQKAPGEAPLLASNDDIADHIDECTPKGVDLEFVSEHFWGSQALLVKVPVNALEQGPADANVLVKTRQNKYNKLSAETAPAIIVDAQGVVEDGNHRLRAAQHRGDEFVRAYVVISDDVKLNLFADAKHYAAFSSEKLASQEGAYLSM